MDEKLKAFLKERDGVLLSGDVDKVMKFHAKWYAPVVPLDREIAGVSMHKARTAALSLPREARVLSARWLSDRGYETLDDGDLL